MMTPVTGTTTGMRSAIIDFILTGAMLKGFFVRLLSYFYSLLTWLSV